MKTIITFLLLLTALNTLAQDTLFSDQYPKGLICKKVEVSGSGRWYLAWPFEAKEKLILPRKSVQSIHYSNGRIKRNVKYVPSVMFALPVIATTGEIGHHSKVLYTKTRIDQYRELEGFISDPFRMIIRGDQNQNIIERSCEMDVVYNNRDYLLGFDLVIQIYDSSFTYQLNNFRLYEQTEMDRNDKVTADEMEYMGRKVIPLDRAYRGALTSNHEGLWRPSQQAIKNLIAQLDALSEKELEHDSDAPIVELKKEVKVISEKKSDMKYNDIIVTTSGLIWHVNILEGIDKVIYYYAEGSTVKKAIPYKYVYRIIFEDGEEVNLSHKSRVGSYGKYRKGSYSGLDQNGLFVDGIMSYGEKTRKNTYQNYYYSAPTIEKSVEPEMTISARLGVKNYFKTNALQYTPGFQFFIRHDIGITVNSSFATSLFLGYASVYRINDYKAVEINMNAGIGGYVGNSPGYTLNPELKLRFKQFAIGIDYTYFAPINENRNRYNAIIGAQSIGLSLGRKF